MVKIEKAGERSNAHQPKRRPRKGSAPQRVAPTTASVKHIAIGEVQTSWVDVIREWRADARDRRKRIRRTTRDALAAEVSR